MSKDQVKKFLDDNKQYADTTEVKIGEFVTDMGTLRALTGEGREALVAKMKEAEAAETHFKASGAKAVELAGKAQKLVDDYTAKIAALPGGGTPAAADPNDPWKDPWYAPIKTHLDAREKVQSELITKLNAALEKANNTIANAATIWAEDRWDSQYNSINFGAREKKPTRDDLIKFATEHNLLDRHKMPSVSAAWNEMSRGEREDDMKKAEFERGREAGRAELIASRVPPPGVSGPGQAPPPPVVRKPGEGELGDLYAEANKDPELRALLEQAAAAGIV